MEKGFREYFDSDEYGRFDEDKQDLDSELAAAAEFLTAGISVVKQPEESKKEIEKYRELGKSAFDTKKYKESSTYYDKVLSINADDADAKFFRSVCSALIDGANETRMDSIFANYILACENMPVNIDWRIKRFEYSKQMFDLAIAWHRDLKKKETDKHGFDWYPDTISDFYENRRLFRKCISYAEESFPIILKSDLSNSEKEDLAFWYTSLCRDYCTETLYYKVKNYDLAISSSRYCGSLGLPLSKKNDVVKIYDDICFEIRKFNPKFQLSGEKDEFGFDENDGFYRLDPPTTYENQQTKNRERTLLQIQKDRETAQKLARWKSEGGPQKEEREKRFWRELSAHVEERTQYQTLASDYLRDNRKYKDMLHNCAEEEKIIRELKEKEKGLNNENDEKTKRIEKLNRKIFGKAKAQEEIEVLSAKIVQNSENIKELEKTILQTEDKKSCLHNDAEEMKKLSDEAKRKMEMFLDNCML